jgi:hypothetical protein
VDVVVFVHPEQAAPAKVFLDTLDRAIEHVANFARPEMPEPPEEEFPLLLVPGAVQEDGVEVG